jgi:hypothetical protein
MTPVFIGKRPVFVGDASRVVTELLDTRPLEPRRVIVLWTKDGGTWSGPDTLRFGDGTPLINPNPCMSPDGQFLIANDDALTPVYEIVAYRKLSSGAWEYLGEVSSQFQLADHEEIYIPFISYDSAFLYFGAYDRDGTSPSGIYRSSITIGQ